MTKRLQLTFLLIILIMGGYVLAAPVIPSMDISPQESAELTQLLKDPVSNKSAIEGRIDFYLNKFSQEYERLNKNSPDFAPLNLADLDHYRNLLIHSLNSIPPGGNIKLPPPEAIINQVKNGLTTITQNSYNSVVAERIRKQMPVLESQQPSSFQKVGPKNDTVAPRNNSSEWQVHPIGVDKSSPGESMPQVQTNNPIPTEKSLWAKILIFGVLGIAAYFTFYKKS
jgi:hypothetical protein